MSDYGELIKALRYCNENRCEDCFYDGIGCMGIIREEAAKAIEKLEESEAYWVEHYWDLWRDRWVSVDARTPQDLDMVVTASRKGGAWFYRVEEYSAADGFHYSNMFSREVKFWVPLPEVDAVERRTVVLQGGNAE